MAVSDNEIIVLDQECQSELSAERVPNILSKEEWREAWLAVRNWIDSNRVAFNAAIPQPARSTLTLKQKYKLFAAVADQEFRNG